MTVPIASRTAMSRGQLITVLGVGFGLAVTVGNAVGAGILRTPGVVATHLQTIWPFVMVWVAGAMYALLGANALAELGTLIPRSGGQYVFVRRGLGDYPGFVAGWSDWLSTCGTTAVVAIALGEYAVGLFPEFREARVVALAVVAALTIVQWVGVRAGGWMQNVTTLVKILALLFFVAACFWLGSRSPVDGTALAIEREGALFVVFILALQQVIFTFDGWAAVIYFSEEVKDPGRNIPRAMLSGVAIVAILYILVSLAFLRVVSLPSIAGSELAAGVVVERLFGAGGHDVLRVFAVLILLSTVSAKVLMAPRVVYSMAKDRLFPSAATDVNRGGTPDVALLISSLVAAAFIITGTFEAVVAKLAFFFVANYTLSFITLFVLRRREPDAPRPYRAWGHPWTTLLAIAASLAFLGGVIAGDPRGSLHAIVLLALSVPMFLLMRRMDRNQS